ncbi:MAG TPA: AAA family ATPase, partial [Anaerolineae bacterium]|nr:AAA family ATPase [Anaerolineae bacterium]
MDDIVSFGAWVQQRRKALDLTQADLAEHIGCAVVTIKKIEQDERRPSRQMADLLAEHLLIPGIERDTFLRRARGQFVSISASSAEAIHLPAFLKAGDLSIPQPSLSFVARERELAYLEAHLNAVLAGEGRVVFITGEAGQGKTTLMAEFARRLQAAHPELIVVGGNCNAFAGTGDPYLPFRDVFSLLVGDLEARRVAGVLSAEQARRLWRLLPQTIQALAEYGPDLMDVLVSTAALAERIAKHVPAGAEWLNALQVFSKAPKPANLEQRQLFEQVTLVLRALAAEQPLLLLLDDLQWADSASLNLLFHLGRRLPGSRILILGAYRASEVSFGGAEDRPRHLLEDVANEFKRRLGNIQLDLEQFVPAEEQAFVDALLDSEPNRLGPAFRETLFRRTKGHPLFTIELLRDMQERGNLIQDEAGRWVEGAALDWNTLPARVEAVIKQRIDRLDPSLQELLTIASVEGEIFTAEVVARVLQLNERELVQRLSQGLDRQHRLVTAQSLERIGQQRLSFYRFRHHLFQHYLYQRLDEMERAYLHEAVGNVLEALYGEQTEQLTVQLAWHFQEAGLVTKAITYLGQAADRAQYLFALAEALQFYSRAIELAREHPQAIDPQNLLGLYERRGETYSLAGNFEGAVADLQLIRQAAQKAGDTQRERALLIRLGQVYRKSENTEIAVRYLHQALEAAQAGSDQRAIADTLYHLGAVTWDQGNNKQAKLYHQEAVEICRKLNLSDIVAV